jgi:hypothetical protein
MAISMRNEPTLRDLLDDETMRLWMRARGNRRARPIQDVLAEAAHRDEARETAGADSGK